MARSRRAGPGARPSCPARPRNRSGGERRALLGGPSRKVANRRRSAHRAAWHRPGSPARPHEPSACRGGRHAVSRFRVRRVRPVPGARLCVPLLRVPRVGCAPPARCGGVALRPARRADWSRPRPRCAACCHGCQQHVEEPGARWRTFSLEPHEAAHPLTLLRAPVSTAEPPQARRPAAPGLFARTNPNCASPSAAHATRRHRSTPDACRPSWATQCSAGAPASWRNCCPRAPLAGARQIDPPPVPHRFCETLQAAKGGDVNSMELLSQMLNEGYGCQRDTTLVRNGRATEPRGGAARSRASLRAPSGALLAQRGTKPRRAAVRRRL